MSAKKLKPTISPKSLEQKQGIFLAQNPFYLSGNNQKFMKMYDWMALGYDFAEKWIGKIKYGNSIPQLRRELMQMLEWENGASVLYVSVGTGADFQYIPKEIDLKTLDITGVDISMGMLKKCKKNWQKKLPLTLINCVAEDLPFADNTFDIVFHNGGINFFSDKKKAISEMLRVAKHGTKLLIADETSDFVEKQYRKSIFSKKYFNNTPEINLLEIEQCLPCSVQEKQMKLLWNNQFYSLTFRKK